MSSELPPDERPERVLADLLALLAIADQAIALQERAEAVLHACAGPDEPSVMVAREGGRLAGEYHRLWGWSLDFAPQAGEGSLERKLSELIMQHCHRLHIAVRLAFPTYRFPVTERRRLPAGDLAAPAAELRSVRDELDLWITALTPAR
jgi:hypothetical protein